MTIDAEDLLKKKKKKFARQLQPAGVILNDSNNPYLCIITYGRKIIYRAFRLMWTPVNV